MNTISNRLNREIPQIKHCIQTMIERFPFIKDESFSENGVSVPSELTEEYLVKLSRRMILAIRMKDRKRA